MNNCVVILTKSDKKCWPQLLNCLSLCERHITPNIDYNIFHEDLSKDQITTLTFSFPNISLYFHKISLLNYIRNANIENICVTLKNKTTCNFSSGYIGMCKFFSYHIFLHPTLKKYDCILRLDSDSQILSPIGYNIFSRIEEKTYGYINIQNEHPNFTKNFYGYLSYNMNLLKIKPKDIPKNTIFYNNFETINLKKLSNTKYMEICKLMIENDDFETHRWGDALLRFGILKSILDSSEFHFYTDIHYFHNDVYLNREYKINDMY